MRTSLSIAPVVGLAWLWCTPPAVAQITTSAQQAAIAAARRGDASYDRLPDWSELSVNQQGLVAKWQQCAQAAPATPVSDCWNGLSPDLRASFFMITYALEHTKVGQDPIIDHVTGIEGVLVPDRATHTHVSPKITATVDGWRIHIMVQGFTAAELKGEHWDKDGTAHETHATFKYTESFRDRRERSKYNGPYLQLVLNAAGDSSDSDLDKGYWPWEHQSSPKAIYERFIDRYPEVELILKIS